MGFGPKTFALLVAVLTVTFVLSPLASVGFNGFTPTQFPVPQNDPPVQPSGYAFSIWGVIYLWLILGAFWGLWRASDSSDWRAMRPPLTASLFVGTFWIAAANVSPFVATIMILFMAATAIMALVRAGQDAPWLQARPVALYAGWLTAASGVAIGVMLGGYAIVSAQTAAIVCLVGVLIVALSVQRLRPTEWGYPAALVWALIGVIAANLPTQNWPVILIAVLGIALLTGRLFLSLKDEVTS